MELKKLNNWLGDLSKLRSNNTAVKHDITKVLEGEGEQGGSGESFEVYHLEGDLHIMLRINTDSYGDNEFVAGITFVKAKEKTVTSFEKI